MKNKFSLILFTALLSTTFAWSAENPAYYELPEGAFAQGLAESSGPSTALFFLPHAPGQKYTFVSKSAGLWTSGSGTTTEPSKEYSYTSKMKTKYHTPQLEVDDDKYQYGSDGGEYKNDLYFRVGDSLRYFMTPAMMYNDQGKQAHTYIANYKSENRDTVGVFFNNTDVMYIDAIRIPITYGTNGTKEETEEDMFPEDNSHVVVNIYKATTTSAGKKNNQVDRTNSLWSYTFTKSDFTAHSSYSYRGTLNKSFTSNPITIDGPFVVELTEMKETKCNFYIYCAQERPGCNKWGYYVGDDGTETYPNYTPAISVRAMFPALYTNGSLDIRIPTEGGSPKRTVFANYKWTKNQNGWKREDMTGVTMNYESKTFSADSTEWYFKMSKNTTNEAREGYVTFTFRGKELKFHLIQPPTVNSITISETELNLVGNETPTLTATVLPNETTQDVTWVSEDTTIAKVDADGKVTATGAGTTTIKAISADPDKFATCTVTVTPTLTPRIGTDNKQTFTFLAAGDDTLLINGIKTTKIYLDSEVKLSDDNIVVESSQGLTKIGKEYGENTNSIRLTLTRKQFVPEEATDIVAVYFKNNQNIRYEYSITQAGVGKLRPDTTSRTFVVGPKGGKALFLNDDNTVGDRYVRLYCDVPASNIEAYYYKKDFFKIEHSSTADAEGHYFKYVSASVEGETTVERLDSFYMCLPNCDTIKFYVRQETTPRVWRHNTTQLTQLEVNNQGGLAHFKGFLTQKVTIVSNTPGTLDINEVEIAFSDGAEEWITPDKTVNSTGDSVFITFDVSPLTGTEPRSTDITVSILDNEFTVPLTQKTFGIEWSNNGYEEELVVPVAGGIANWKGSYYPYLNVFGTEAYRDSLLKVTAPEGVEITRQTDTLTTGRQATYITFSKKDTLTADWSGEITVSFDSTNTDEGFDYHFFKTFTITQAAAKMWYDANQSKELSFEAEGGDSENIKIWANFPFSYTDIKYVPTNNTEEWFSFYRKKDNAIKDGDNYYYLFYIKTKANTEEERSGSVYVALKNKTEIKTETLSFTQLAPTAPEPDFTLEDKAAGAYATICLPGKIDNVENATLFHISHGNINKVEFEAVTDFTYELAGMPYLVQVTETGSVKFFCDKNKTTTEPVSRQDANGFVGSLQEEPQDVPDNGMSLLVSGGQLHLAAENCHLTKNHAYIDVNNVPASPIKAPNMAARRVTLYNPNAVPTNLNGLNGTVKPMKVLRDGQLYIIRDTKTYNAQGIEVQ